MSDYWRDTGNHVAVAQERRVWIRYLPNKIAVCSMLARWETFSTHPLMQPGCMVALTATTVTG